MKTRVTALLTMLSATCLLCAAPAHAPQEFPFVLRVSEFHGAEGSGYDYCLSSTSISVVAWNDFGSPRKVAYQRDLTAPEGRFWSEYLAKFPVRSLKTEYSDPRVKDGMQRTITFKSDSTEKKIRIANVEVPELKELCQLIDALLPPKLKIENGRSSIAASGAK